MRRTKLVTVAHNKNRSAQEPYKGHSWLEVRIFFFSQQMWKFYSAGTEPSVRDEICPKIHTIPGSCRVFTLTFVAYSHSDA